jgi:hypothetical protein
LCKAKEKRAWSELFLHAALYLHGEQSLPADPDGRYREMPDISGQAAGMTVVRGGAVAGGVSAAAPAVASASLTGPARAHNPACEGHRVCEVAAVIGSRAPGGRLRISTRAPSGPRASRARKTVPSAAGEHR